MDVVLLILALLGHAFIWVGLVNRTHGRPVPRGWGHVSTLIGFAFLGLVPIALGAWFWRNGWDVLDPRRRFVVPWPAAAYLVLCWGAAVVLAAGWIERLVTGRPPALLRHQRTRLVDLARVAAEPSGENEEHHFLIRVPGNQTLQLDVVERGIAVPRLPAGLDGLSIVHLSDFHFTGRVPKAYFQEVVRRTNELAPDLVAVTGDLIDNPERIDWVPDTFGRLAAPGGCYFVLGNHDLEVGHRRIRQALLGAGLVDLGGRWVEVSIRGQPIVLAGNELPWIPPAADLEHAPPPSADGGPVRIVLSHSPDQLDWAKVHGADLLLAGHLHGGQIRLPLVGAIFSPSRTGVRYACGLFYDPPTILHVTRGVSGEVPIRLNCPPEIVRLVLHTEGGE